MSIRTQHTAETLSPASIMLAAKAPQGQGPGKKSNAEAAPFDQLLNSASSAQNTKARPRTSASGKNTDQKTSEASSEAKTSSQSASQTNDRSDKTANTAEQLKTEENGQIPPREPEEDSSAVAIHDDAALALETAFTTDETSPLLQAGLQNTPQTNQSSTGLSETQISDGCSDALPSKQETVQNTAALQDAKTLFSFNKEISAASPQIEENPEEKTKSFTPASTTLVPDNNEKTSDSRPHQQSDARTQGALNNFISSIKESQPPRTLSGEQCTLSTDNGDKQNISPSLPNNATLLEKADFAGITNREAALVHQMAQSAKTLNTAEIHAENTPSTMRAMPTPDSIDNKAHMVVTGNRLAVALEPEGLGKLNINLSLDRGTVNAQIQVSDPAARTLLENNMQQILDTLMNEGLSVGGFSVSLKHGEAGNGEQAINGILESSEGIITDAKKSRSCDRGGRVNIFV